MGVIPKSVLVFIIIIIAVSGNPINRDSRDIARSTSDSSPDLITVNGEYPSSAMLQMINLVESEDKEYIIVDMNVMVSENGNKELIAVFLIFLAVSGLILYFNFSTKKTRTGVRETDGIRIFLDEHED